MNTLQMIHTAVCKYYDIDLDELFNKTRKRHIVERRQIFFYLGRDLTNLSQHQIGLYSEPVYDVSWDHATVRHAENNIRDLMSVNKNFSEQINTIKNIIKGIDVEETLNLPKVKDSVMRITLNSKNKKKLIEDLTNYLKTA